MKCGHVRDCASPEPITPCPGLSRRYRNANQRRTLGGVRTHKHQILRLAAMPVRLRAQVIQLSRCNHGAWENERPRDNRHAHGERCRPCRGSWPHLVYETKGGPVGMDGFEPPVSCSQSRRPATGLHPGRTPLLRSPCAVLAGSYEGRPRGALALRAARITGFEPVISTLTGWRPGPNWTTCAKGVRDPGVNPGPPV